jgi:cell pole-organizing protein PopZ
MTRLDHGAEPSMEDILASIRKIIAEEPPGSRPLPPQQRAMPSSTAVLDRPPLHREPLSELRPAALEPYLRASTSQTNVPAYPSASVPLTEAVTPVIDRGLTARSVEPEFEKPSPAGKSIDDQLADLLDDAPAIAQSSAHASASDALPGSAESDPSVDVVSKLTGWPSAAETSDDAPKAHEPDPRPGFTVSRAGYVPDSKDIDDRGPDPFDFDLGPSPFELKVQKIIDPAKPAEAPAAGNQKTPGHDFAEAVIKPSIAAAVAEALKEPAVAIQLDANTKANTAAKVDEMDAAPAQPAPTQATPAPMPAREVMREVKFVTPIGAASNDASRFDPRSDDHKVPVFDATKPSVTATLPPQKSEAELDAAFAHSKAQAAAPTPSQKASARAAPLSSVRASSANMEEPAVVTDIHDDEPAAPASSSSQNALTFAEPSQSAIEDSVADLLRPMLKNWLAENMPKIVERALRREFSEQARTEHKSAAE